MSRYYFHVRNGKPFDDVDGLDLPDMNAVHAEATGFARDLMRLDYRRRKWSKWAIEVTDEQRSVVLNLPFESAT